ncbi:hypothetical protein X566_01475 [Afipia sp. P52-10]|uniref:phage protease n=1 Tax=Afipia sp. P52-10 TaxID=1429916 RepID=UPI0003DF1A61|nr:phage protease [Afipia sp. P52-10]ETR79287.1 hypothetical protein X566_01475 [Afipia sp. P52-10]
MSRKKANPVLMTARGEGLPIALNAEGGVEDWIMLLPAGSAGVITTVDGRGPYRVADLAQLAAASLQAAGGRLAIDENHSTDLAAPKGEPAPARGWAVELQARADGLWGRIEWGASGAALMSERAYRFISPVFTHDRDMNITGLLRASLTNTPNLRGMAALHAENSDMDLLAELRKLLGLAEDADAEAVIAKVKELNDDGSDESGEAALQAALAPIAKAAGLKPGADAIAIATAVTALAGASGDAVKALQTELTTVTTELNSIKTDRAKERATAFIDGEIGKGRVGVKALRDHYIARHMADPATVEKEIAALPAVTLGGTVREARPESELIAINAADPVALAAAAQKWLGEQKALGRTNLTISDAVTHIKERAK